MCRHTFNHWLYPKILEKHIHARLIPTAGLQRTIAGRGDITKPTAPSPCVGLNIFCTKIPLSVDAFSHCYNCMIVHVVCLFLYSVSVCPTFKEVTVTVTLLTASMNYWTSVSGLFRTRRFSFLVFLLLYF